MLYMLKKIKQHASLDLQKIVMRNKKINFMWPNMAIISIEKEIAAKLSYDKSIEDFASIKARKVPL